MAGLTAAQQYQLLNKQTAAVSLSKGFDLSSLANQSISALVGAYDQVQVKNGQQSIILERSPSDTLNPTDIAQNGSLQVVPSVGAAATNYQVAQRQAANTGAIQASAATPTWEKYAVPIGIGAAALIAIVLAIRHG